MTVAAISDRSTTGRGTFSLALLLATAVPFLPFAALSQAPSVEATIAFLATIHVPMTAYLFFDPAIRSLMWRRPLELIVAPVLVFAFGYFGFSRTVVEGGWAFVLFFLFVQGWNFWHFGKQNVGVYSFMRLSQSIGSMARPERWMIVAGSALGVLIAVFQIEETAKGYVSRFDFAPLRPFLGMIHSVGLTIGLALFVASVVYIVRSRQRMTWSSSVALLISVNFFLPGYLAYIPATNIFGATVLAHGCQYMVFLFFHAASYRGSRVGSGAMIAVFAAVVLVTSELYYFKWFMPPHDGYISMPLSIGILLTHFWIDQVVWRLRSPDSRAWVTKRYAFLFGK